jgi:hypothetical protein
MTAVKLFTIHGINTHGSWQETLRPIFEAHFAYQPIKYAGHRFLFGIPQILFSICFNSAIASVIQQYDKHTSGSSPRHYLIAHSYGTVLSTFIMRKFQEVEFHRTIFLGSPLNSKFDWSSLKRIKFELTNEYGSSDLAVWLAKLIFWRDLIGDAGRTGFKGPNIHTITAPLEACVICSKETIKNNIHNISLEYRHSDYFLSTLHARIVWLPIFWGYTPKNYKMFVDLCREAVLYEKNDDFEALANVEDRLMHLELELGFDGTNQSLKIHIDKQLKWYIEQRRINIEHLSERDVSAMILRGVWHAVNDAWECPNNTQKVKNLWPPLAVRKSIQALAWLKTSKENEK